jgi:hypothetical protein
VRERKVADTLSDLTKRWIATEILAEAKRIGTHPERVLASSILRRVLLNRLNEEKLVTDQLLDVSKELARVIAQRQGVFFGTRADEGHRALISVRPENWQAGPGRQRIDRFIDAKLGLRLMS